MISDLLLVLLKLNLAAGAAVLLVLALRGPILKTFGARAAYALWLAVPMTAFASLLPALRSVPAHLAPRTPDLRGLFESAPVLSALAVLVWLLGAAVFAARLGVGQRRFMRKAAKGQAGPAIVGFLDPRLILPDDFTTRFTPQEQALIRAHERVHLDRDDPRANAVLAALQCLFWYNPLVHMAASRIRLDQELACDAVVVARFPRERRRYAETMLKTQLAEQPLPVGCTWLAPERHPLEARIALLRRPAPPSERQLIGLGLITAIALVSAGVAWSAQPPRIKQPPPPKWPTPVMNVMLLR